MFFLFHVTLLKTFPRVQRFYHFKNERFLLNIALFFEIFRHRILRVFLFTEITLKKHVFLKCFVTTNKDEYYGNIIYSVSAKKRAVSCTQDNYWRFSYAYLRVCVCSLMNSRYIKSLLKNHFKNKSVYSRFLFE